ncbi:MAG: F0F1 ATP synthase subunit B [Bacteroidota bacterium]
MDLLLPKLGLFFWSLVIFVILVILLRRYAWKPILESLNKREASIQDAIDEAKKAREEMANLKAANDDLLRQARVERDAMLKEARDMATKIRNEANATAQEEASRIIEKAREDIRAEKMQALTEVKNQVAQLSLQIAEKVLRHEMKDQSAQSEVVDKLVSELTLN